MVCLYKKKVTYSYNICVYIDHMHGYKSYGYDYVNKIGCDKFPCLAAALQIQSNEERK